MTITHFQRLSIHYFRKGRSPTTFSGVKYWKMKAVHDSHRRIGVTMKDHCITWYRPAATDKSSRLHFPGYMLSEIEYYTCGAAVRSPGSRGTFCPPLPQLATISYGTLTCWHDYQFLTSWSLRSVLLPYLSCPKAQIIHPSKPNPETGAILTWNRCKQVPPSTRHHVTLNHNDGFRLNKALIYRVLQEIVCGNSPRCIVLLHAFFLGWPIFGISWKQFKQEWHW